MEGLGTGNVISLSFKLSLSLDPILLGGGQKPQFPELENELFEWLNAQASDNGKITREIIKEKARSIYNGDKFVASDGWVSAFLKRYKRKAYPMFDKNKRAEFELKLPLPLDLMGEKNFNEQEVENQEKSSESIILSSDMNFENSNFQKDVDKSLDINQTLTPKMMNHEAITQPMNFEYPLPLPDDFTG